MKILEQVKEVLKELSNEGDWDKLLRKHGLDISATDLEKELIHKDLSNEIDREFPGFRDFACEGKQGICPGSPARSLLYHALASPNVRWIDKEKTIEIGKFPSLEQLEIIENYVYAAKKTSLEFLRAEYPNDKLAVVIFANQYRTAVDTPHQKHADMVYARTGVARIGTAKCEYDYKMRSFKIKAEDSHKVKVLPAKYNAYLAVKKKGSPDFLGRGYRKEVKTPFITIPKDKQLSFWYPVHKLFNGPDCLEGKDFKLEYFAEHANEKIRKTHKHFNFALNWDTGTEPSKQLGFPFVIREDIARFDPKKNLVIPIVHDTTVDKATSPQDPNKLLSFKKPVPLRPQRAKNTSTLSFLASSLRILINISKKLRRTKAHPTPRPSPEFVHCRTKIEDDNVKENLNEMEKIKAAIKETTYNALHYIDYTGDGYVGVRFTQNNEFNPRTFHFIWAYSIIAPPDFFPFCEQTEVFNANFPEDIWEKLPLALSDVRFLPNIKSHPALAHETMEKFDTCTALVSGTIDNCNERANIEGRIEKRITYLTDGAAGILAPGWDTSFDMVPYGFDNIPHLANYGMGSPYTEDARICAAMSSYWPAVAPDTARSFWPSAKNYETVIPLTDEEIGSIRDSQTGWDGEPGPKIFEKISKENIKEVFVKYKKEEYVDYTLNALNNTFDYHTLSSIDAIEYLNRVQKFQLAKKELVRRGIKAEPFPILISYRQEEISEETLLHRFRFMTETENHTSDKTTVTQFVKEEETIVINNKNEIVHQA